MSSIRDWFYLRGLTLVSAVTPEQALGKWSFSAFLTATTSVRFFSEFLEDKPALAQNRESA